MPETNYHHGDLPSALRSAAVELIAEKGPSDLSLREVARRAGVSHAAPAHHFGDKRGLLTSIATEGYNHLVDEVRSAVADIDDPREHMIALGKTYINTALANPGHYGVMIGHDFTDRDDPDCLTSSLNAHALLLDAVIALRDAYNPDLDVDATSTICWAGVHGLVQLSPILEHVAEMTDTTEQPLDELIEKFVDQMIDGIRTT